MLVYCVFYLIRNVLCAILRNFASYTSSRELKEPNQCHQAIEFLVNSHHPPIFTDTTFWSGVNIEKRKVS